MADWIKLRDTISANGDPRQFWDENGEEVFILGLERVSGGGDDIMHRRVIGMGRTRASAARCCVRAMKSTDSMGDIILPR